MRQILVLALVPLLACDKATSTTGGPAPTASAAAVRPVAPPEPPPETPIQHIDKLAFAQAVDFAKGDMSDTVDTDSPGAAILAIWASKHMKWTDVAVASDETTFALVLKDADEARTKRICMSGQIVQIEVEKLDNSAKLNEGLLLSNGGNIYRFIAAGSSGTLVAQSYGRFCGLVTGKYDYSNSVGGTGHAVAMVGMFDLPENKPKK